MAIAFGNNATNLSTDHDANGLEPSTLTGPTVSGSDTVMYFAAATNGNNEPAPTSATYDSASLGPALVDFKLGFCRLTVWGPLVNPGSAKAFTVTWGSDPGGQPFNAELMIVYYTGVHQTTPNRTPATNSGSSNPATVNVTNSQSGDVILGFFALDDTTVANGFTQARMGAGQTFRATQNNSTDETSIALCDEPGASGTVTHSWDFVDNGDNAFCVAAIPLIPAAGALSFTVPIAALTLAGVQPALARAPDVPTNLQGTAGDQQVELTWTAPADDGGSALTDYIVQYRPHQ